MIKHLTASVFILFCQPECRVVLLHHERFGKWMVPGGHVERWENPFEAAQREVREETGLHPYFVTLERNISLSRTANSVPSPEVIVEENIPAINNDPEHIHVDCLYLALVQEMQLRPGPGETTKLGAFTIDQLAGLDMFDQTRNLAQSFMVDLKNGRDLWSVTDGLKFRSEKDAGYFTN